MSATENIVKKAQQALGRYRFMAYVTGVMLLLLTVEMLLVYVFKVDDSIKSAIAWIPFAHGWIYVIYLITVIELWVRLRWNLSKLTLMVLGGVIPVMSFIVERKIHVAALIRITEAQKITQNDEPTQPVV